MANHILKIWPEYFHQTVTGLKTAQLRKNDRHYQIGDILVLREFDPRQRTFSGQETSVEVTDLIEKCAGLERGYCILSIKLMPGALKKWCPELAGTHEPRKSRGGVKRAHPR